MEEHILTKEKISLDEVRPKDREEGYPKDTPSLWRRFFEFIPGIFTWLFILSPLIVSLLGVPEILVFYIGFLLVYWIYRGFRFAIGLILGWRRVKRDMATDWMGMIKKKYPEKFRKYKFAYLCPTSKEGIDTLRASWKSLTDSDIGADKITLIFALEERFSQQQIENFKILKNEFGTKFAEMVFFIHPNNIEGEIFGVKGGNINWSTRKFVELLEKRGEDIHDYLLISVDSDWRPHEKFLSAVMYKYFSTENPDKKFYASALHTFNNNLWDVPPLIRIHSATTTLVGLQNWVVSRRTTETFSAYVANLKTIKETGYWSSDIQNDDTAFYWNALIRYGGDFSGVEVYIPTYNDAVENENFKKTHISLYKQQYRWGWGVIVFPITLAALVKSKTIPLLKKLVIFWTLFEMRLLYLTVVYLLTLGLPLLNLLSPEYVYSSASYNLPKLMSILMTALMLLNFPVIYYKRKVSNPKKEWPLIRHLWDYAESFLITINMLTFTFIPYIQANTELMIGKKKGKVLYITDKVAIKK